ncbi:hypothetical protein M9Q43_08435 [Flavobacterium sp. HXWNR29]|uniref:hypothetical protein n=1 Tax=Flavobacterium odoriferum TaxID=2946604 RepID=UPI0021CB3F8E|nr:hypothetical protein [Flavobacterium sp. HXWNR29]MCU4189188.1 hypothetical protein [Flavobacterium sp. HXWNR29]
MDLARHCELCDNQKINLEVGTTCGLTERKPEFNKTCSKIQLNEKFEKKLKSINIEYENIKRKETLTYTYFAVYLLIGIAVIVSGYLLGKYALNKSVISTVPIIIMGASLAPLGLAFGTLNNFRQSIQVAKNKKDKIDEVLNEYRIEYEIDITFGEEIHGTQEVHAKLKTKGIR